MGSSEDQGGRRCILQLLKERPVVGDGSYVFTLEKRGYVKVGPWTPEAVMEYPDAVQQLHRDFLRAGADVLQAFTFYATDGKLQSSESSRAYTSADINEAGCRVVAEVARPAGAIICGGISPTPTYANGQGDKVKVREEFQKQLDALVKHGEIDFLLAEFFGHIEETEIAIDVLKTSGLPVAVTMRVGPTGDIHNVSAQQCAIRMAKAGADIVGINCQYDPATCVKTIRLMKEGLDAEGLSPFLMLQPVGFNCPECAHTKDGYHDLPEFPLALEPRLLTRADVRRYVREALDAGVRYFGGCCGFEPYHIREVAEELSALRGFRPPGQDKYSPYGAGMVESVFTHIRQRTTEDYWMNLKPASGRPDHMTASVPQENK